MHKQHLPVGSQTNHSTYRGLSCPDFATSIKLERNRCHEISYSACWLLNINWDDNVDNVENVRRETEARHRYARHTKCGAEIDLSRVTEEFGQLSAHTRLELNE